MLISTPDTQVNPNSNVNLAGLSPADLITPATRDQHAAANTDAAASAETQPVRQELPRRAGESRFAPRPYFYGASRTGVVPSIATGATSAST
jgi:hypothetical protein